MAFRNLTIAPVTITTAVTAQTINIGTIPQGTKQLMIHSNFVYGSGGTTAVFYLQTTIDGTNWIDIACLSHTTASLSRLLSINGNTAAAIATTSDGALTANTKVDGFIGDALRIKYTTTGTYAGSTTYTMNITAQ